MKTLANPRRFPRTPRSNLDLSFGRQLALAAALTAVLATTLACGPASEPAGEGPGAGSSTTAAGTSRTADGADQAITILSPHHDDIKNVFETAFSAWHQEKFGEPAGITYLDIGGTGTLLQYIDSEYTRSPEGIGVDLLFGGGTEPYLKLHQEGKLQPYPLPDELLAGIPETYGGLPVYADDYSWYGAALSGFGLLVNKRVLELEGLETPESWEDLTAPELFNRVGSADPRRSGSTHMSYEIILQAYGWEKGWEIITLLGANARGFAASGSDIPRDVATGDAAVGLVIDLYAWAEMEQTGKDRLAFHFPAGRTVVNPDGIAIFRGAPNPALAQRFVQFVMSPAGQKLWMLPEDDPEYPGNTPLFRMSVLPALYEELGDRRTVGVNPFEFDLTFDFDADVSQRRYDLLNDLLDVFIITPHNELQKAWQAVAEAGLPEPAYTELTAMPLSLEEALRVIEETEGDSVRRQRLKTEWLNQAEEKYQRARELAGG